MKRGFLFSIAIFLALSLIITLVFSILVYTPRVDYSREVEFGRQLVAKQVSRDFDLGPYSYESSGKKVLVEIRSGTTLATMDEKVSRLKTFIENYDNLTHNNIHLEDEGVSAGILSGDFGGISDNTNFYWDGNDFYLETNSNSIEVDNTILQTNAFEWNPALETSGDIEVRVKINNYDSGVKYVNRNTTYSGWFNFTTDEDLYVYFENGTLHLDYDAAPSSFTQRISINDTDEQAYYFSSETLNTTSIPQGWSFTETGTKVFANNSLANFVLLDQDSDNSFDFLFVDENKDGDFVFGEKRYLEQGSLALINGKAYYITFDLSGNWISLKKVLGVVAGNSVKAMVV